MQQLAINGGTPVWAQGWPEWPIFGVRERENLTQVLASGAWAYDGPFEEAFQRSFADYHSAQYGIAVTSGIVALELALEALDVGYGDEVIVPVNTWQATAVACLNVNAVPIFVDVEPDTYMMAADQVEAAITSKTRAIIPVHLYCSLADLDRLFEIAQRHDLALLEDCAHSHGSRWRDRGVGSVGNAGCFSFQGSKSLNAGEGGFVTTNDPAIYERLYSLRNCGRQRPGADDTLWDPVQGGNSRMTEWQAAVLEVQLERLPEQVELREENLGFLNKHLAEVDGIAPLIRRPQVTRQGIYAYVFRYNSQAFDDVPVQAFRQAMGAELGASVTGVYHPLNHSPLYQPQTKRRYRLSEEHWQAIDPTQFETPVAEHAYANEAVVLSHTHLLAEGSAMQAIVEAVAKLHERRSELSAWASRLD